MDRMSTRQGFGRGLMRLAEDRDDILVASADTVSAFSLHNFATAFPERFFEFGISEQNMLAASAAMASEGYTVFCLGQSPFLSMRALEQIRTFIAYPAFNVKIIAGFSGLSGETNGVTHQGTEDISVIRSIPNMTLYCPADAVASEKLVPLIADLPGPIYYRVGRSATPIVYPNTQEFPSGGVLQIRNYGDDLAVITAGPCVYEAVAAADRLEKEGIHIQVLDLFRIKPINALTVINAARRSRKVITVEDGSIMGGIGGAVAEVLLEAGVPCKFKRMGLKTFGTVGELPDLLKFFGLDSTAIELEVKTMLSQ